jgi:hypothetical protein
LTATKRLDLAPIRCRRSSVLYLPLKAPLRMRGVLAVAPEQRRLLMIPEQRQLLDTFAALIAIALERVHFVGGRPRYPGQNGRRAAAQLPAGGALPRSAHAADRA